ncbi:hypothetical protein [Thermoactinomyces sp. DSM 45892]|uniref:hypothetical protein n=1 Tax=Thermoactinomyces sp. DSM 45892 TaxID=1882753 RepID=UPI00089BAFEE|nr:hypothetical protein [Thermoactinomyces sp. DSM 45892]SDY22810.1 hypothetical protein SAMN05444416_10335 [Thermoactinomyces sp. DSM 45892]
MRNENGVKYVTWKLTEEQVTFLNHLLGHCPHLLGEEYKETYSDTRYELNEFRLELEKEI